MATSLASLRSSTSLTPPRLLLYGVAGVGKTSLAAAAPNPVFLQTEDGLGVLNVPTFGLLRSYYPMLQRNLIYTGVTRGKRLVVLVGQRKALSIAVRGVTGRRRWSKLREWLAAGGDPTGPLGAGRPRGRGPQPE